MRFKDKDKGNQRRERVYNYLIEQGLQPHLAAGVLGNLMQESYQHLDPNAVNDTSGAFGIAQWLGARKERLMEFAKERGTKPTDFETQLEYLAFELNNPGKYSWTKSQRDAFFNAKTVEEAAWLFQDKFERAGESMEDEGVKNRIRNAKKVYLLHNDDAIYAKDAKGQIVNVNPETATPEQVALSPKIRDEFYQDNFNVLLPKDQNEPNDPPEAVKKAEETLKQKQAEKDQEREFIKKLRAQSQQQEEQRQPPQQFEQPAPPNPRELTPGENEFFASFIPRGM